jgi:NADP-dependent 3-hydroxy acid dehydrogenase YdfG
LVEIGDIERQDRGGLWSGRRHRECYGRSSRGKGAFVFLAGRTLKSLESVEAQIRESGGLAQSGVVDALDERSVEDNLSKLVRDRDRLDVSYNLMSTHVERGARLAELSEKRFSKAAFG